MEELIEGSADAVLMGEERHALARITSATLQRVDYTEPVQPLRCDQLDGDTLFQFQFLVPLHGDVAFTSP